MDNLKQWFIVNKRYVLALVIVLLLMLFLYVKLQKSATLIIKANSTSEIFIAHEKDGDFTKLGEKTAKYTSRNEGEVVYVKVVDSPQVAITSAKMVIGEQKTLNIIPEKTLVENPKTLSQGSVQYPFISSNQVYGISTSNHALTNYGLKGVVDPDVNLIVLPYMKKVLWGTPANFMYVTYRSGVGLFNKEQPFINYFDIGSYPSFIDAVKYKNKPFVLLSDGSIYTMNGLEGEIKKIVDISTTEVLPKIFSTNSSIYYVSEPAPSSYVDGVIDGDLENIPDTFVDIFDYSGKQQGSYNVKAINIVGVVETKSSTNLLTDSGLVKLGDSPEQFDSYFTSNNSLFNFDSRYYLLNDYGLWFFDADSDIYYQVYQVDPGEIALKNSILVKDGEVIFGTQQDPTSDIKSSGNTYSLTLN